MAENKTTRTDASVEDFLASVPEPRQSDARELNALLTELAGCSPAMWGPSIVGFGDRHLVYASGRELDWFDIGYSPRKASLTRTSRTNTRADSPGPPRVRTGSALEGLVAKGNEGFGGRIDGAVGVVGMSGRATRRAWSSRCGVLRGVGVEVSAGCARMTLMKDLPPYLQPFVLDVEQGPEHVVERVGQLDFHRPAGTARTGAILFIHGGPGPADLEVSPRDWPVYQGYAAAVAQRGLVAVTVDHSLIRGLDQLATAADEVEAAIGLLRADPQIDPDRVGMWFFSGAGLLAGEWLDSCPDWLRLVALTYPRLVTPPGVDELVSAAEVIGKHKDLPVLLTRVGRERAELAGPVAEFVSAGGTALDIIDVPKGQHGFDMLDHDEESRAAVTKALDWAIAHLGEEPAGQLPIPAATIPAPTRTPKATAKPAAGPAPTSSAVAGRSTADASSSATTTTPSGGSVAAEVVAAAEAAVKAVTSTVPASQPASSGATTIPTPASAETAASRVVGREHAAYEVHDLEAFLAMYSPTAQLQLTDGTVMRGRRSLREYYQPRFEAGQCKTTLIQRMLVGDWVVDQQLAHHDQGQTMMVALYSVQDGLITEVRFLA